MARIPLGDFGNVIAQPGQSVRIPQAAFDGGSGAQKLGDTAISVAGAVMDEKRQQKEAQRQQEEALARATAANAVLDREISVKTIAQDIEQQLADGRLRHKDAPTAYKSRVGELIMPDSSGMDAVTTENLTRGIKRTDFGGETSVASAIERARVADFKGQTDLAIDKLGKLAGMPGADVEAVAKQVHSLDALGQAAYGKNWEGKKQEFSDKVWFNEATQRAMQNRDNMSGLKSLESELTDANGRYSGKLDTEKRNFVLRAVIGDRMRLENKIQHNADRMEAKAEHTINEIDRQLSSGVPASPQMWDAWATIVKGTSFGGEFRKRIEDEAKVQEVLRLPIEQQRAFVQQRGADLLNGGGSVRDKTNLDRLRSAVDANLKQLQEAPLLFAQNRTGQAVQPLDISALADPNGAGKMADVMRDRVASITALQKQYGPQVQMRPLLPQEAQVLSSALNQASPKQQAELFVTLRNMMGNDIAYRSTMQQIAPDNPVMAEAGVLKARSAPVAEMVLRGQQILNPDKKTDGKGKMLTMPPEKDMELYFSQMENDAFAGKEKARSTAYQTALSIYAAKSVDSGSYAGTLDYKRWKESINAATGGFETYHGRSIVMPYGMPWGDFKDGLKSRATAIVKSKQLDPSFTVDKLRGLPLENVGDGRYIFRAGDGVVTDKHGKRVLLDFNKP